MLTFSFIFIQIQPWIVYKKGNFARFLLLFRDNFIEDWRDTQTPESGYKCFTFPHISAGVTFIYESCLQAVGRVAEIYNFPAAIRQEIH